MASSATDVFVSYKAEDRARLLPLVKALEAEGFTIWWDAHIGGGTDWREEIQQHLDAARCVIVAWSERSVGSEGRFVRDEATRAQRIGSYVPVRIDPVDPPLGFGEVQAINFVGWKGKRGAPCFVSLVDAVNTHLTGEGPTVRRVAAVPPMLSRRAVMAGGTGALAVAGVGGWALLKPGASAANRIAVMSFSNLSSDPEQAYFSEGIAEELRGALSRVGMQVIGKASCDAVKDLATPAVASKLGVANILTGSVRRSSETIRVGAQLVNGKDGFEKWAENYDRAPGDTIKIQTDIATQVASALSIALGAAKTAALTLGGTDNSTAQDLVLRADAISDGSKAALQQRIVLYDAAIALDRHFAAAYAGKALVSTYIPAGYATSLDELERGLESAATVARKAVSLAPGLPAAHYAYGVNRSNALDFAVGFEEYRRAVTRPGCPPAIKLRVAEYFAQIGGAVMGDTLLKSAAQGDPLNPDVVRTKAALAQYGRRYGDAVKFSQAYLAIKPSSTGGQDYLALALLGDGRNAEAKEAANKLPHNHPDHFVIRAVAAVRMGDRDKAAAILTDMRRLDGDNGSYQYAEILTAMGDSQAALGEIEAAFAHRDAGLAYLLIDPLLDPLRNDPRFAAIVRKLDFPNV